MFVKLVRLERVRKSHGKGGFILNYRAAWLRQDEHALFSSDDVVHCA